VTNKYSSTFGAITMTPITDNKSDQDGSEKPKDQDQEQAQGNPCRTNITLRGGPDCSMSPKLNLADVVRNADVNLTKKAQEKDKKGE